MSKSIIPIDNGYKIKIGNFIYEFLLFWLFGLNSGWILNPTNIHYSFSFYIFKIYKWEL